MAYVASVENPHQTTAFLGSSLPSTLPGWTRLDPKYAINEALSALNTVHASV
jgi:hypothetical protein